MLLELPLPAVPAVEPPAAPLVEPALPVEPAPLVDPAPVALVDPVLLAELLAVEPEPIRALVSMNWELPMRDALAVEPAVPLVPVAPVVPLAAPPLRHPVTVIVRLPVEVWLPVVDPACADMLAAQPSAIANVAPVHTLFMRFPPIDTPHLCAMTTPHA